jgi:type IV pilus assembly protein PilV
MYSLKKGGRMHKQQGFSLIEILITMVITSIGLLGIAGLIVTSLKNNQGSYSRTQASMLANDIVDRMRANRGTAESASLPYNLAMNASPSTSAPVPLADLIAWRAAVASSVPEGKSSIVFDAATMNVVVTIQWDDSRSTGDGSRVGLAEQQMTLETRL